MEPKLIDMAERFPQIARRVASDKDWNEDKSNSFKLSVDGENYLCKLKGEAQKSSPREAFYIDCLKGMTVNEFPIYTNALFKGMCPLMMSSIMCYNKKKEDVLVPVKLSTEIGQLEIILTDARFCAATYQLNVYNCYYANKYLNEDGGLKITATVRYQETSIFDKRRFNLPFNVTTKISFFGEETDAVFDVVEELLNAGFAVAVPNLNSKEMYVLKQLVKEGITLDFE